MVPATSLDSYRLAIHFTNASVYPNHTTPFKKRRPQCRESFRDILDRPYENRAFSALYPPGSTFKTIVASAWIEENGEDPSEKDFLINGRYRGGIESIVKEFQYYSFKSPG